VVLLTALGRSHRQWRAVGEPLDHNVMFAIMAVFPGLALAYLPISWRGKLFRPDSPL